MLGSALNVLTVGIWTEHGEGGRVSHGGQKTKVCLVTERAENGDIFMCPQNHLPSAKCTTGLYVPVCVADKWSHVTVLVRECGQK